MKLSWRGTNVLFLLCSVVQFSTEGHITAFTPLLLRELGLTTEEIAVWTGLLVAIMMAMALPLAPFWGVLAERFSRRPVILRGYVLLAAALLVTAFAADVRWLIVARMLMGFCFGTGGVVMAEHLGRQEVGVWAHSDRHAVFQVEDEPPDAIDLSTLNDLHWRRAFERGIWFFEPAADIFWFHQAAQTIEQTIHLDHHSNAAGGF